MLLTRPIAALRVVLTVPGVEGEMMDIHWIYLDLFPGWFRANILFWGMLKRTIHDIQAIALVSSQS